MVSKIEDGSFVCSCFISNLQCVLISKCISNLYFNVAGVSVFAICTGSFKLEVLIIDLICYPYTVMESNGASTVKAVGTVVDGELIALVIKRELTLGNAVAITSDKSSEVATLGKRILRTETAPVAAAANVFYELDKF